MINVHQVCLRDTISPVYPRPFVVAEAVGGVLGVSGVAFSIIVDSCEVFGPGLRVVSTSEDWSVVQPHS